jgi:hypothetical protein
MKHFWILFSISVLVLTACGPTPEPTMSPADVQGTAMAAAMTMVAETQAAIPSATPIPPTEPPTATPFPTNTVPPLVIETSTPTLVQAIGALPTNTSSVGSNDPCNQPLTSWEGESAKMYLRNNTKPKGSVILALGFTTEMGECGIISASFSDNATITVPMGVFWASAFVSGKKDFKVFGGDVINRTGNHSLWIENERIILKAGCAPNC